MREILKLIAEGESQKVEFKVKVKEGFNEEICAFANSGGGYIIIGVDDKGNIVGCNPRKEKEKISGFFQSLSPVPKFEMEEFEINGKKILVLKVYPTEYICTTAGRVYIRMGTKKRYLDFYEIARIGAEKLLISPDSFITEVGVENISEKCLRYFERKRRERGLETEDIIEYLEKIGVIRKGKLSFAGVLFFLENPQEYYPHTFLRYIYGEEWKRFDGPIWKIIDDTEKFLLKRFSRISFTIGFERRDYLEYPIRAVREAITNALVHRNYLIFSEVFVKHERDKLIISNPGGFPPGVTPERPRPVPRNPLLYELLFQVGYIERQGIGIEMIKKECLKHPFVSVEIKTDGFTDVIFYKRDATDLDDSDLKILEILKEGPKTSGEISKILGISKPTVLKRLKKLISKGLVKKRGRGPMTLYHLS